MTPPEVGPVARNTSSRVITILTARPVFRDRTNATGSKLDQCLAANQFERFGGDRRRDGRRGHRMALIKGLISRHDIGRQVAEVHRAFADKGLFWRNFREIGCRGDRAYTSQGQCAFCVYPQDASMSVRAALDLAVEHARHRPVGPKVGATRDLLDPVRTSGSGADDL